MATAVATPARLPVPTRLANETAKAWKEEMCLPSPGCPALLLESPRRRTISPIMRNCTKWPLSVNQTAQPNSRMIRTYDQRMSLTTLIAIAAMLYFMFFKSGTPEDTVQKMEDALNRLDQQELLECFDEQTQGLYSGMLGVGGDLLGFDLGALSDLASGLGGYMSAAGLTPQFDLTVVDVQYTGDDTCLVTIEFAVTYQGTSDLDTETLPMIKDGRDWVISAAGLQ